MCFLTAVVKKRRIYPRLLITQTLFLTWNGSNLVARMLLCVIVVTNNITRVMSMGMVSLDILLGAILGEGYSVSIVALTEMMNIVNTVRNCKKMKVSSPGFITKMSIQAYTDGSCKPNPGLGGWAWIYFRPSFPQLVFVDSGGVSTQTTNNRMETLALIKLLRSLRTCAAPQVPFKRVDIHMDTLYVLKGLLKTGEGRLQGFSLRRKPRYTGYAKAWNLSKGTKRSGALLKNSDLWRKLDKELTWWMAQKVELWFHWVKGHSGDSDNDLVDKFAQDAVP